VNPSSISPPRRSISLFLRHVDSCHSLSLLVCEVLFLLQSAPLSRVKVSILFYQSIPKVSQRFCHARWIRDNKATADNPLHEMRPISCTIVFHSWPTKKTEKWFPALNFFSKSRRCVSITAWFRAVWRKRRDNDPHPNAKGNLVSVPYPMRQCEGNRWFFTE
jgi:hypothetical protein